MFVGLQLPVVLRMYRHTDLIVLIKPSGRCCEGKRILIHRYFTGNIHLIIPVDPAGIQNHISLIAPCIQTGDRFPGQFRIIIPSAKCISRFCDILCSRQRGDRIFRRSLIALTESSSVFLIINSPLLVVFRYDRRLLPDRIVCECRHRNGCRKNCHTEQQTDQTFFHRYTSSPFCIFLTAIFAHNLYLITLLHLTVSRFLYFSKIRSALTCPFNRKKVPVFSI